MCVQQISVFLENRTGRMAAVTRTLGEAGINIRALSIADTSDFGILRLIVDDPAVAAVTLREAGFTASLTGVLAVEVPDAPGGLARALAVMEAAGADLEYLYAFCEKSQGNALVIFRIEEPGSAMDALADAGFRVLAQDDLAAI